MSDSRLDTVTDYINEMRTMLLDTTAPYRYLDPELLVAFNTALLEGRRLRPDLFVYHHHGHVPYFPDNGGEKVRMEHQFRLAFVYGAAAHALARDDEDVQDARVNAFRNIFEGMLTGLKTPPMQGGNPGPGDARR